MKLDRKALLLYAVTDRHWLMQGEELHERVAQALKGGATFVQLREKKMTVGEYAASASTLLPLTRKFGVPLVINDSVEAAILSDADGVHIGQGDMPVGQARSLIGENKILGVSADTLAQALDAQREGADYLGVGAIFPTSTKEDAAAVSLENLKQICAAVSMPVVAIGGINKDSLPLLEGSGAAGAALVSALFAEEDTEAAARELRDLTERIFGK